MKISRRNFLLLTGGTTLAAAYGAATLGNVDTTELIDFSKFTIETEVTKNSPLKVGFLTDIHLGPFLKKSLLIEALDILAREKPDVLLLGGDYLWLPDSTLSSFFSSYKKNFIGVKHKYLIEEIYAQFSSVISQYNFPLGIYGVLGNHDRWIAPDICKQYLQKGGVKLLVNELQKLTLANGAHLELFGTDDYWTGIPKKPPFKSQDRDALRILLSHNPDFQAEVLNSDSHNYDLGLSGHTHGGQIQLPLIGAPFYNVRDQRFKSGMATIGNCSIFTSRGLGTVEIPYRLNCPPEVTLFEFV